MKRIVGFIAILLISCTLFSCGSFFFSNIQFGMDGDESAIICGENTYSVWTFDAVNYTFYKLSQEELVGLFMFNVPVGIYKVENPDFGTAFRMTVMGFDYHTELRYIFAKGIEFPDVRSVIIDDIVLRYGPLLSSVSYTNNAELMSNNYVVEKNQWCKENESLTLEDILDLETEYDIMQEIKEIDRFEIYVYSTIFTLKDYNSFVAGSYNLVEHNGHMYLQTVTNVYEEFPDAPFYRIRDEYQELFKNAIIGLQKS